MSMYDYGWVIIFLIIAILAAGFTLGVKSEREIWCKETVERGFAEHDSKTGEWQWKETNE